MVMDTRQSRRKRRNSAISASDLCSSTTSSKNTRQTKASTCETPRQSAKRVRFSDPGPQLQNDLTYSTGLTPAMLRTSFDDSANSDVPRTPSRAARRRSTPLPRRRSLDPLMPMDPVTSERVVQFTPLRQILDSRTQRRIRRVGLSDEINNLEREKREVAQYEKSLQTLLQERDALKKELESSKRTRDTPDSLPSGEDTVCMSPQAKIDHLESENGRLREEISSSFIHRSDTAPSEGDTISIEDSGFEGDTILMSYSPDLRGSDEHPTLGLHDLPPLSPERSVHESSPAAPGSGHSRDGEILALSRDLEAARKEKKDLFNACRARFASLEGTPLEHHLRQTSPPPEFFDQLVPSLTEAVSRASNAVGALDSVKRVISGLGFPGEDVEEIVHEMRDRFRSARLQLERAVPGETANAGLNDGNATLGALVKRVELLVGSLREEQVRHEGTVGREKALRRQFDDLLVRYEGASKKIGDLEASMAASAGDMLHTRMRLQELEREGQEQIVGIDRLNVALSKYRDEVKSLEQLVTDLEKEKVSVNKKHNEQVSELETKMAGELEARRAAESALAEREARIHGLEATVEQNRIRACDLTARVESIERERRQTIESLEQQATDQLQRHQQEVGSMNVRVSELTTSLEGAKSEMDKLRRGNTDLEEQLRLEVEARDSLLDRWAADQARSFAFMKETVNAERRRAKVRTANFELKSDELQSDSTNPGSEPITPVSMTRFVDVEVGRGKQRRTFDSGIGILTDDLLDEAGENDDRRLLPSDPADL
ncbi:uncharacterized protein KD926_009993 [Aspergillus affinis]|uniref:uncharacterized protein n=1 Tax=Aspergillus affinis TaxID=1070780 RepID=UPI0022FDFE4F|nr:uncharacterized protein KD926_009993 [Aspergillus affinis]KAI9039009.1 hypothetical protein KD926_009993 [Aspergillus affinis]